MTDEELRDRGLQCPGCGVDGSGNGRGIAFVCQNADCRVTAFTIEAVNDE